MQIVWVRYGKTWRIKIYNISSFVSNQSCNKMNIERIEFLEWMKRITDRLDILSDQLKKNNKNQAAIDGEVLLDNQDLLEMLKVSSRTLQRYRTGGKLPYYSISGKLYYKLSDVHQFIRESFTAAR